MAIHDAGLAIPVQPCLFVDTLFSDGTMKRFLDSTGKQWEFDVNLESIERVKSICNVDLSDLFGDDLKLISSLFENPSLLVSVLWELCEHQDDTLKAAFRKSMRGDSLELAASALVDDVIDFFPNARRRELCRATVQKLWQTVDVSQKEAEKLLAGYDPTSLNSVTSSAELPVSIPDHSPSAS